MEHQIERVQLQTMSFHGDEVITFEQDGEPYVAMRRVVENLDMSWGSQRDKLTSQRKKFNCTDIGTVGADGKARQMLSIPVKKLPLWLATINPNKITDPAKREKIELYQEESATALFNYWHNGVAIRDDMDGVVTSLDPKVMQALGGMFKAIVHKQLAETLPDMIQAEISKGHYAVVSGLTASQVLDMAGVKDRKGLRGLANRVSNRLCAVHIGKGVAMNRATLGPISRILFDPAVVKDWLLEGGRETINQWIEEKQGQGRLRLVRSESES